jgi:hypothetical protein
MAAEDEDEGRQLELLYQQALREQECYERSLAQPQERASEPAPLAMSPPTDRSHDELLRLDDDEEFALDPPLVPPPPSFPGGDVARARARDTAQKHIPCVFACLLTKRAWLCLI